MELSLLYSEYIEYVCELRVVTYCFIQQILIEHSAGEEMNDNMRYMINTPLSKSS